MIGSDGGILFKSEGDKVMTIIQELYLIVMK